MAINYQFGDVDAHGALIRAAAASQEAEHRAVIREVLAAGGFPVLYRQASSRLPTATGPPPTPPSYPAGPNRMPTTPALNI
jgi:hypothetical protein